MTDEHLAQVAEAIAEVAEAVRQVAEAIAEVARSWWQSLLPTTRAWVRRLRQRRRFGRVRSVLTLDRPAPAMLY